VLSEKRVIALANDTALITKDGREVPIEDSAAPIKDSADNAIGMVLVFHDVSERRRTQKALREAHERAVWLARFPEQNPNPIIRASADGTVLYCNPASARLHGWTCEVGGVLQNELLPLISLAMAEGREVQEDVQLDKRFYIVWVAPFPEEGYANIYGRDITERKQGEVALRNAQRCLEADLDAMTKLQKLGTLFLHEGNLEPVLTEIVDAAIAISGADFGNIQLVDPESSDLNIAAQRGFPQWWLDFWNSVSKGQGACGTALERGERVIVEDVEQSPIFVGTPALEIQLKAGVRAVQSTPLVSRSGKPLGMFSTHYKTPCRPDDRQLRLLDLLARQTADIVERAQAEEALRERTLELQELSETLEQQVQERTEELKKANEALRHLSLKLLSAQEEERKRIAGEIHDTLGACLSAIKFKVESVLQGITKTPSASIESLGTIIPVIQEGVEECRRIQMDLRPSMLDDLGLLPTLSWFCRRFQTIYSGIRVDQEVTIEESEVPISLKIVAFRVTQEAMNNVAKHSKANTVRLCLRKIDGRMEITVEDNGQGFDLEKVLGPGSESRGLGFTNMRERAELSGGSFEMESTQGKGTVIRVWWPLPAK
jgi:signal transduction histidine kinase